MVCNHAGSCAQHAGSTVASMQGCQYGDIKLTLPFDPILSSAPCELFSAPSECLAPFTLSRQRS